MIWLDTDEKFDWFLNVLKNDELQVISRNLTEEDCDEISREIAEYKAMRKNRVEELLLT